MSCIFRAPNMSDFMYTTPSSAIMDGNSTSDYGVNCYLPIWIAQNKSITQLQVSVYSKYKEESTSLPFIFHETLNITHVYPPSGPTVGGNIITIYLTGYLPGYPIYPRFSELISVKPCILWQYNPGKESSVNCTVLAHTNGKTRVMLSYDQSHWYMQGGSIFNSTTASKVIDDTFNYDFLPCPAGYQANDFSEICIPCPPGSYKPTEGIYSCIPCQNGTYTPLYAQSNCSLCPILSSSSPNSTNYYDCGCDMGYYYNPISNVPVCLPCPEGATCNVFNTTIPSALPGWWHSEKQPYIFYNCFPEEACLGGGFSNCSVGYDRKSNLCGQCDIGYYKWRNACVQCSPNAWYKLILAVIALGVITVAFFAISSAKVSHLASISIAFSFWQIIAIFAQFDVQWPAIVSNSFTVASLTNFNIDFLSPQCVFLSMNYVSKWIVITLLPFYFAFAFGMLYIFGEIRVFFTNRFGRYIKIKYLPFRDEDEEEDEVRKDLSEKMKKYLKSMFTLIINILIWCRNFSLWLFKDGATRHQMRNFLNKVTSNSCLFEILTIIDHQLIHCIRIILIYLHFHPSYSVILLYSSSERVFYTKCISRYQLFHQ